jgi:hypothetical protein
MTDQQKQQPFADEVPGYVLAAAVRKELCLITTAGVCIVGIATATRTVVWCYLEHRIPQIAHGVPGDAIMAFDRECPEGSEVFSEATSRVIVGYGTFKNLSDRYSHDQHSDPLAERSLLKIWGRPSWHGSGATAAGARGNSVFRIQP